MINIIEEVKKIPIKDVIQLRIEVRGNDALCPFHDDNKLGSFKISSSKNIYKCFSCGEAGDGINFISKYDGISYVDAAYKIAYELELISEEEFKSRKINSTGSSILKNIKPVSNGFAELRDEDVLNLVYQVIANSPLSEDDKNYLMFEKGLSEDDIKVGKYFTMLSEKELLKKVKQILRLKGLKQEVLIGVPGFYMDKEKIRFNALEGIGIPIKSWDGKILGIQVRTRAIKGERQSRYLWCSSSFANGKDDKKLGCSAGSNLGVVFPNELKNSSILITEGHFKAVKYANTFGSICITVQGVNSYEGIEFVLSSIKNHFLSGKPVKVLIGYDADMIGNLNVFKASVGLVKHVAILEDPIYYLLWDEDDGKGLDDLISANKTKKIQEIPAKQYQQMYLNTVTMVKEHDGKLLKDSGYLKTILKKNLLG